MDRGSCQTKARRARNEPSVIPYHHDQQSPLHGALLHPALRLRPQNSLFARTRFLYRPSRLRSPHPHVRLSRDHVDRARYHGIESDRARPSGRMDCGSSLGDLVRDNFSLDPTDLSTGLVYYRFQIFRWRIRLSDSPFRRANCDFLHYTCNAMKKIIALAFVLITSTIAAFAGEYRIAFERSDAVYVANLDGTAEKKIADGIFPAISPDGTQVAFNTVEKTSDTTYIRQIAVTDVATSKTTVFKDVPSDNSYYPTWSPDGKRILFTLRQNEVWDLGLINPDGTDFRVLKKGTQNEVTHYSPIWARDGQSVFCQDMTNIYQLGLDGSVLAQWKIQKIIPRGDMSGDCRIDVSPDGKHLLLGIEMGEEANRKDWDGPVPALWSFDLDLQHAVRITPKKLFGWDGVWIDNANVLFLSQQSGEKEASIYRMSINGKDLKRLIRDARFPSVSAP